MNMNSKDMIIGVSEAARILKISGDTVRRWHKKGLINAIVSPQGERQFRLSDLNVLLQQQNSESPNWKVLTAPKTKISTI